MKSNRIMPIVLIVGLLAVFGPAEAHHGNSAYDEERTITITGTVTEFAFVNPHTQIFLDVKDDKGNIVHWAVESQSPGVLRRNGWSRTTIKAGDQITLVLNPAKNGASVGFSGKKSGKVILADGSELKMDAR
jgi:hypothetical protein